MKPYRPSRPPSVVDRTSTRRIRRTSARLRVSCRQEEEHDEQQVAQRVEHAVGRVGREQQREPDGERRAARSSASAGLTRSGSARASARSSQATNSSTPRSLTSRPSRSGSQHVVPRERGHEHQQQQPRRVRARARAAARRRRAASARNGRVGDRDAERRRRSVHPRGTPARLSSSRPATLDRSTGGADGRRRGRHFRRARRARTPRRWDVGRRRVERRLVRAPRGARSGSSRPSPRRRRRTG